MGVRDPWMDPSFTLLACIHGTAWPSASLGEMHAFGARGHPSQPMGVPITWVGYMPPSDAVTDGAAWVRPSRRRGRPSGRCGHGSMAKEGALRGTGTPMGSDDLRIRWHRYAQADDARAHAG